jgi:LPPG:FO 2-phospho-L-lactate transferase
LRGSPRVALLAGGTGGAKLAAGFQAEIGERLSVIANPADDETVLGIDVSPDPDLITYWLAGQIDEERGWGIAGDTFTVFDRLGLLGAPDWFRISDRDLATCIYRSTFVSEGGTRTAAQAQIASALGVTAAVLPATETPIRTRIKTGAGWRSLQQYLIADGGSDPIEEVNVEGLEGATATPEVLSAVTGADLIVIGPSNPVLSIGPILGMPDLRSAVQSSSAPVIAVSPLIAGRSIKGPTEECLKALGRPSDASGIASLYEGLLTALVCDDDDPAEDPEDPPFYRGKTLMENASDRQDLARSLLQLLESLT